MDGEPSLQGSRVGQTSSSLLYRARSHDPAAWEVICTLYTPLIHRWSARFGVPKHDMADVAQDVLLAVYRSFGGFRRDEPGQSFRGWLKTITWSKAMDLARTRVGRLQLHDAEAVNGLADPVADEPSQELDSEDESVLLQKAFSIVRSDFPGWYTQAFDLLVLQERSTEEVANRLGKAKGAIWNAKSRILKELRLRFSDLL